MVNPKQLAQYIDHTCLKLSATQDDITKLCLEAKEYGFKGVCVRVNFLPLVCELLKDSNVLKVTVVGFPTGKESQKRKIQETQEAISLGADEIDMVINIAELKAKNYAYVLKDIEGVVKAASHRTVKVIIETCLLSFEEKFAASVLAKAAGAHFVKTSTGFSTGGATVEDVTLLHQVVGKDMQVKASGGIKTHADALKMIEAGATRLGTSSSVAIVT